MGALAATPRPKYQDPFRPLMPGVRLAEFNNPASAAEVIDDSVCAVIVEPVQGEGGVHPATNEFMVALRELTHKHDALLILDEVQCGVGRTGTFWAHEPYGILPDILCAAKPLANGLPIGAVLVSERVAEVIHPGDHGTTFAGGPFVTAVADVVVRRVSDAAFLQQVADTGAYFKERLEEINSPHIKEVRGRGLMLGVQLDIPAAPMIQAGYEHGLLLLNAGPDVLRLIPPLIFTPADADIAVERLAAISDRCWLNKPSLRLSLPASLRHFLPVSPSLPYIRRATDADVLAICALVNGFADQNLMLYRTPAQVRMALSEFLVAEDHGEVVGCGYLAYLGPDLVEIRSLAVAASQHGKGVGGRIVNALVEMAQRRGISQVCALTLVPDFFIRHGFEQVDRWSISPKIWSECVYCPKFHTCDEIAVLKELKIEG